MDDQQDFDHDDNNDDDGGGAADGFFNRVNGGMIQSGKYADQIVSLIGQIIAHNTIRTADGSTVTINTENLADENETGGGLIVNPHVCVEIMGQVTGATEIMAFIARPLAEMDLELYNKCIGMLQESKYKQYFSQIK